MSKKFLIAGSIVDTDADRYTFEDVTPAQFNSFLKILEDGEDVVLEITSFGGSCTAGLAICNMLKRASSEGHKTTAHVIGIAASMASAIACACDKLEIDANAFLMVHNPWSMAMGNAGDLRKEADTLDKFRDAFLSIYRTKFDLSDEALKKMLDDETWILGEQAELFNLKCEVIPTAEPLKIAASLKTPKFFDALKNTPKALREMIMENKDTNDIKADATPNTETVEKEEKQEVVTETVETETVEETVESAQKEEQQKPVEDFTLTLVNPTAEELNAALEKCSIDVVTKAECDKRVSGMQSAMAKQMNDLKKTYEAKIEDFTNQLKVKDEELISVKAQITSLTNDLESAKKVNEELLVKASALESTLADKTDALAKLNAEVNTPNANKPKNNIKNGLVRVMQPNGSMKTIN